jgi:hypothetical protein
MADDIDGCLLMRLEDGIGVGVEWRGRAILAVLWERLRAFAASLRGPADTTEPPRGERMTGIDPGVVGPGLRRLDFGSCTLVADTADERRLYGGMVSRSKDQRCSVVCESCSGTSSS